MASKRNPSTRRSFEFTAKIVRAGGGATFYCIDVPVAVSRAIGVRGYVSIVGTIRGVTPFRASLVPRGGGRHRILLNAETRRAAAAAAGDRIDIELRVDHHPPRWPTPEDLAAALGEQGVLATFASLALGKRNHILQWVDKAVHDVTRAKRIARVVEIALAEHEKRLDRARNL